jgi:hypothetical protein
VKLPGLLYSLQPQLSQTPWGSGACLAYTSTLKMAIESSSETLVNIYYMTWCNIPPSNTFEVRTSSLFSRAEIAQSVYWWAMGCSAGIRFPAVAIYSILHSVQIGSGAQPPSYPTSAGGCFPGVKRERRQNNCSPPSSAEVKIGGATIPSLSPHVFMA